MNDLGGVKFFNVVVETPEGDAELLAAVLKGMNAVVDESAEERRGGAGHLGKMLLSAGDKALALLCNIPKDLASQYEHVTANEWMDKLVKAAEGEVTSRTEEGDVLTVVIAGNTEKGQFPLKMRDAAQSAGFAYLREKGLLPDQDSDDDYVLDPEAAGEPAHRHADPRSGTRSASQRCLICIQIVASLRLSA